MTTPDFGGGLRLFAVRNKNRQISKLHLILVVLVLLVLPIMALSVRVFRPTQ